jgi:hypothetical protein
MNFLDRQLVDEIPKYYITMLIHRYSIYWYIIVDQIINEFIKF